MAIALEAPETASEGEQTLEEMADMLRKAGYNVTAEQIARELEYRMNRRPMADKALQIRAAKANGHRRVMRDHKRSAFGEVTMQMTPGYRNLINRQFGREALLDAGFCKDLLKAYPEFRVVSRSDRLTIVKPEIGGHSAPNRRTGVFGRRGRWAA